MKKIILAPDSFKGTISQKEIINILKHEILKRNQNMTLNRWINFTNSIKYTYKKEVDFLLEKDLKQSSSNYDGFELLKVNENE